MIVRNPHTGALHEVPDQQLYEVGDTVYDGFGNPVGGLFDNIVKGVGSLLTAPVRAATSLVSPVAGAAGGILGRLLPGGAPPVAAPAGVAPGVMPSAFPFSSLMRPPGMPFRPPWPAGWVRPPLPYTGLGPRRLYMRCAVWPGPQGLVPGSALTMQPQPVPGAGVPGGPSFGGRRFGRRRRRR